MKRAKRGGGRRRATAWAWATVCLLVGTPPGRAEEATNGTPAVVKSDPMPTGSADKTSATAGPKPGHSLHGEVFDEGPRQEAYLLGTTGRVSFPVGTKVPQAQAFFDQGLGQLHGFWYFEAERSFRQVLKLDPQCGMAYWGLAMANVNNAGRARKFLEAGKKLRDALSARERLWFDALVEFYRDEKQPDKERRKKFIRNLENIVHEYPDDVEAKAFLAWQIWAADSVLPISSRQATDSLLDQVFAVAPDHPAHHYRIHLWDEEKAARALKSAAAGGPAAPGIAHMWHMPGHIYSKTDRYVDAVRQQAAAVRVDHAYMRRDGVLPHRIHNYAHNSEWLVRNHGILGRLREAEAIALNLIEQPRHPQANALGKGNSAATYGRTRFLGTAARYELWERILAAADRGYLDPASADDTDLLGPRTEDYERERLRYLGAACFRTGNLERGAALLAETEGLLARLDEEIAKAGTAEPTPAPAKPDDKTPPAKVGGGAKNCVAPPATDPSPVAGKEPSGKQAPEVAAKQAEPKPAAAKPEEKPKDGKAPAKSPRKSQLEARKKALNRVAAELRGWKLLAGGDAAGALKEFEDSDLGKGAKALVQLAAGQADKAAESAKKAVDEGKFHVHSQAVLTEVLWRNGKRDEAKAAFERLRTLAGSADFDLPCLVRLAPLAVELGYPSDWRLPAPAAADLGAMPEPESLGPLRWRPQPVSAWRAEDVDGAEFSSVTRTGKPTVLIFYLGGGCLPCVEQLGRFAQQAERFRAAGIEIAAVSTEALPALLESRESLPDGADFPLRLIPDPDLSLFKRFKAYDEFEGIPLHGTVLLDGTGRIRWQDAGAQPFSEAAFLRREAIRLLALPAE